MDTILNDLASDKLIWDARYNLPLMVGQNNPHLNLAYANKILLSNGVFDLGPRTREYIDNCQRDLGMFNRYPDGSGGQLSQDEMIGIKFNDFLAGSRARYQLKKHLGFYPNNKGTPWYKQFIGRHYWLWSYLDENLDSTQDFLWSLYCDSVAGSMDKGASHHLMVWLMSGKMLEYPQSRQAIFHWREVRKAKGLTMAKLFNMFFPNNPWFGKYVKEDV